MADLPLAVNSLQIRMLTSQILGFKVSVSNGSIPDTPVTSTSSLITLTPSSSTHHTLSLHHPAHTSLITHYHPIIHTHITHHPIIQHTHHSSHTITPSSSMHITHHTLSPHHPAHITHHTLLTLTFPPPQAHATHVELLNLCLSFYTTTAQWLVQLVTPLLDSAQEVCSLTSMGVWL